MAVGRRLMAALLVLAMIFELSGTAWADEGKVGSLELPVVGATGYTSVELPLYKGAYSKQHTEELPAGTAFLIEGELKTRWLVSGSFGRGWVDHQYCMINLPDVLPSIVYDITNGYSSIFRSAGHDLPGITGEALYTGKIDNQRLGRKEFVIPVLYAMAGKIGAAQAAAMAQGDTLVIYEGYRPMAVQKQVAEVLSELAGSDPDVAAEVENSIWDRKWFIAQEKSNHQLGCAIDVSLAHITKKVTNTVGDSSFIDVTEYETYKMPSEVHELSIQAAAFSGPVSSLDPVAWRSCRPAPGFTYDAKRLQEYCTNAGLSPLASEWWHFNDLDAYYANGQDAMGEFEAKECLSVPVNMLSEYLYDENDSCEDLQFPEEQLASVIDPDTAVAAVDILTGQMTEEQKASPIGIDLATHFAEIAVSKAANKQVSGNDVLINAESVADLEDVAEEAAEAMEAALASGDVLVSRHLSKTITFTTEGPGEITIRIDPDILGTKVDRIRVNAPDFAITFKISDLGPSLTDVLVFSVKEDTGQQKIDLKLPEDSLSNTITVSMPCRDGDTEYQTIMTAAGSAVPSKYDPITGTIDGKVSASGTYIAVVNKKDFIDIADKSDEMQSAIRFLASKGIVNGTSQKTFSPDNSISRAEIAMMIVKALGKLNKSLTATFKDVTTKDWFYAAAASSLEYGIIKGYDDGTFRGNTTISKAEIVAAVSRALIQEMNYIEPANIDQYLDDYNDAVAKWARSGVALATKEHIVTYRADGTFAGAGEMTRGDAAVIIYRLLQRIW